MPAFVAKAELPGPADRVALAGQKTMYGGVRIAAGDALFLFTDEARGGAGLAAWCRVERAVALPRAPGTVPRVDVDLKVLARPARRLGRAELRGFRDWRDGRPETELNFKFFRQATNKIGGISEGTAAFLRGFFPDA
jgi:hypothetical protein